VLVRLLAPHLEDLLALRPEVLLAVLELMDIHVQSKRSARSV
jgi:hypothetical protein